MPPRKEPVHPFAAADAADLRRRANRGNGSMPAIAAGDALPAGPYGVGLTSTPYGVSPPFTLICGAGRALAGHIESYQIAQAIAAAMNAAHPAPSRRRSQNSSTPTRARCT
jgi:hypothetical protein